MDRTDRLLLFVDVVQHGNFSRAALKRNVQRSIVGKQISRLEEELGVRLINRTTRTMSVTEIGRDVYRQALRLRDELSAVDDVLEAHHGKVAGDLRINSVTHFGRRIVQPAVARFIRAYPEVTVELRLDDRFVDLVGEGWDLGIRIAEPRDSTLIARKIADVDLIAVAAPEFIERFGEPSHPRDLERLPCVVYCGEGVMHDTWHYREKNNVRSLRVRPAFRVNDGQALIDAVKAGLGIGLVARFLIGDAIREGSLTSILRTTEFPPYWPIYALYPARRHLPHKTRVFLDMLVEFVGSPPIWEADINGS